MKSRSRVSAITAIAFSILSFAGCQSLAWKSGKSNPPAITNEQYIQQAAANVNDDTDVRAEDDMPVTSSISSPAYTSPPPIPSPSSSGGSCCH